MAEQYSSKFYQGIALAVYILSNTPMECGYGEFQTLLEPLEKYNRLSLEDRDKLQKTWERMKAIWDSHPDES